MSEEKNIEESQEYRKTVNQEEINENISLPATGNQQPEIQINTSDIITSEIENMGVHKHPHHVTHKKNGENTCLNF